jgi:hypothetical protein
MAALNNILSTCLCVEEKSESCCGKERDMLWERVGHAEGELFLFHKHLEALQNISYRAVQSCLHYIFGPAIDLMCILSKPLVDLVVSHNKQLRAAAAAANT